MLLRGLWGSTHPGPTLVVTALAVALGVAAGVDAARLVLLGVAVFAGQVSVGISNDAIDAARDRAVGRTDKPIAAGTVSERAAWTATFGALGLALVLSIPLGAGMLAAHAIALASAWAYNAGLKASPFSLLPFIVSFGLFPSFATLSVPGGTLAPIGVSVAGAALGAAVHLTNVLPDLDDDARTGIRGLPHRLGARVSTVLAAAGILIGATAVLVGPLSSGAEPATPVVAWSFFAAVAVVAVVAVVLALTRSPHRVLFRLTMLAALLLAVQLVVAG